MGLGQWRVRLVDLSLSGDSSAAGENPSNHAHMVR